MLFEDLKETRDGPYFISYARRKYFTFLFKMWRCFHALNVVKCI